MYTIRVLNSNDDIALQEHLESLTQASKQMRYMNNKKCFSEAELSDILSGNAVGTFDNGKLVAVGESYTVGRLAELAVSVSDLYQGKGLGTTMLEAAKDLAIDQGANTVIMITKHSNTSVHGLINKIFPVHTLSYEDGEKVYTANI